MNTNWLLYGDLRVGDLIEYYHERGFAEVAQLRTVKSIHSHPNSPIAVLITFVEETNASHSFARTNRVHVFSRL